MKSPRSERAPRLVDAMLGVSLLMQGLADLGQANAWRPMVAVALSGGVIVLAGTIFRRQLEERFPHSHATVTLIEGVMCALIGAASARRGTSYIQYAWFAAAVAFISATVIELRKKPRSLTPSAGANGCLEHAGEGQ